MIRYSLPGLVTLDSYNLTFGNSLKAFQSSKINNVEKEGRSSLLYNII